MPRPVACRHTAGVASGGGGWRRWADANATGARNPQSLPRSRAWHAGCSVPAGTTPRARGTQSSHEDPNYGEIQATVRAFPAERRLESPRAEACPSAAADPGEEAKVVWTRSVSPRAARDSEAWR